MQTFRHFFIATLTHQDTKQHIPYRVHVPAGTRSLRVRLSFAPHVVEGIKNLLTLTILDPGGFRGAAHRQGDVQEVVIQEGSATPGFFPGPLPPGAWTVLVDTHMIMPGAPLALELVVTGSDLPDPGLPNNPATVTYDAVAVEALAAVRAGRGPGWYRGDLHAHTIHSDAAWDIPGLLAFARANRLDFVTLSDHNTVSGLAQFERECPPEVLPVCGSELTTFWGHALALGRRAWVDWRILPGQREMSQVAAEVEAQGGLFIIAHPLSIGDPYCTGCSWGYADMRPGPARVVEVWNSPWSSASNNELGLQLAYEWMNSGLRLVLTAGSDRHGPPLDAPEQGFNVVYAELLSEDAILRAVRAGHLYLSSGPALNFSAQVGNRSLMMGDSCRAAAGETIRLQAEWSGCPPGAQVELVVDGEARSAPALTGADTWDLPGGQVGWALLALRDEDGQMLALTNPLYFDGR